MRASKQAYLPWMDIDSVVCAAGGILNFLCYGWVTGHGWRFGGVVSHEIYDKLYIAKQFRNSVYR